MISIRNLGLIHNNLISKLRNAKNKLSELSSSIGVFLFAKFILAGGRQNDELRRIQTESSE